MKLNLLICFLVLVAVNPICRWTFADEKVPRGSIVQKRIDVGGYELNFKYIPGGFLSRMYANE